MASIDGYYIKTNSNTDNKDKFSDLLVLDDCVLAYINIKDRRIKEVELALGNNTYVEYFRVLTLVQYIVENLGGRFELATEFRVYMDSYEQCVKFLAYLINKLNMLESICDTLVFKNYYYFVMQSGGIMRNMNTNEDTDRVKVKYEGKQTKFTDRDKALEEAMKFKENLERGLEVVSGLCLFNSKFNFNLTVDEYLSIYN